MWRRTSAWRRSLTVTAMRWHHDGLRSRPREPRSRPRQQRHGPMMASLDLGLMSLDLGSGVFYFQKLFFDVG
jgi:hypothetical protein